MTINNPAYKTWLGSVINPYETIAVLEKSEVSDVDLSDIADALDEYVRLFKAEIASPAEILTLSRAYPDEEKYSLAVIDKELDQEEPVVIGGPASVEVVDREGHLITLDAMRRAFERFMANFRTRNAMVLHSDVQVGWALPAYIAKSGKIYKSGVTGDHLFFITELRNDTKIAKKVLEQIDTGKMKSYSIAGSATSVEPMQKASGMVMQVNDMELAEVTICEQGVNQKAKFELMKSSTDRPTSSCVDGSCLIKAQEHKHSETELFMDENGIIDTVGSFTNWVQKETINDPEDKPRLAPAAVPVHDDDAARKNRERVAADKGNRQVTRWNKYTKHKERNAPTGNQGLIEDMQKSHSQGCVCETCGSASSWADKHADDTSRDATDRQGRPTLGHTGHGHAVAILISRMHRKADTKAQQDKKEYTRGWSADRGTFPEHLPEDHTLGTPSPGKEKWPLSSTATKRLVGRLDRKDRQRDQLEAMHVKRGLGTVPNERDVATLRRTLSGKTRVMPSKNTWTAADIPEKPTTKPATKKPTTGASKIAGYDPDFKSMEKAVYQFIHKRQPPDPEALKALLDAGKISQAGYDAMMSGEKGSAPAIDPNQKPLSALERAQKRERGRKRLGENIFADQSQARSERRQRSTSARRKPRTAGERTDSARQAFIDKYGKTPEEAQAEAAGGTATSETAPEKPKKFVRSKKQDEDPPQAGTQGTLDLMEKGVGAAAKKLGSAALGAGKLGARVAGAPLEVIEGLAGSGIIGNIARVGEQSADKYARTQSGAPTYGSKQPAQAVETLGMEKEWTTPQTETPLHKFLDYHKRNQD